MTPEEKYLHARDIFYKNEKYDEGHEVSRLMHQAACTGCVDAMFFLGYFDNLRYWCLPSETAMFWYRTATEKGDLKSTYALAKEILQSKKYCNSVGFDNAKAEAIDLLRKAAAGGVTAAASTLYYVYAVGLWGLEPNQAEADKWARRVSECRAAYNMRINSYEQEDWDRESYEDHAFLLVEEDYTKFINYGGVTNV